MSVGVPKAKLEATKRYGGEIVLYDTNSEEMQEKAEEMQLQYGYTFVYPFNNQRVIVGQGTIGLEILEDLLQY